MEADGARVGNQARLTRARKDEENLAITLMEPLGKALVVWEDSRRPNVEILGQVVTP